jgi:TetR/AcrR family transcriptional regulator, tetracycline repressor protein
MEGSRCEDVTQSGRTRAISTNRDSKAITADMVLTTAMRMIESEGVDAFSMRKLATELGVGSPTVYWHVGNRDELFNRLIEQITDQLGNINPDGDTPANRISSISRTLLEEVRARPQLIALSATQGRGEAIFIKAQAALAHEVSASGLSGEDAAFAVGTILFHLGGYILLDYGLSHDYRVRGAQQWVRDDADIDETMRERLLQDVDLDKIFQFTLDAILASLLRDSKPPLGA